MAIDSLQTQALRNDQARLQLEHENDKSIRETREKAKIELERTVEHHSAVKQDLDKAFEITISNAQDSHDKRLAELHMQHEKQLEEEQEKGEAELEKMRSRYQEQIARYRENSEKAISDIQKQNDVATANMKRAREKERGKA
jgi:hypothetical protein